jgi:hypothetical protein
MNQNPEYQMVAFLCASLDDLEAQRIATENRLRALTRDVEDKDGEIRGLGLPIDHPDVAVFKAYLDSLSANEATLTKMLERNVKRHPLGPWILAQRGVGLKQGGRLLGAIMDPYWNSLHERPRTVAELWAYCGLVPGQKRKKGVVDNWSGEAKKRVWLITQSTLKAKSETRGESPWRDLYDDRRIATRDRVHADVCVRCGPAGKPAQPGSPWSLAHAKADADRYVGKRLLKELWRESKRLHEAVEAPPEEGRAAA